MDEHANRGAILLIMLGLDIFIWSGVLHLLGWV